MPILHEVGSLRGSLVRRVHHAGPHASIENTMLELFTWTTPNGKKPAILLAELGVKYTLRRVDLSKNEQKSPEYLALNPNGKIPALVDADGSERVVLFESGAILEYLAMKHGRFLPTAPAARAEVMSWLFWQIGGPGPMFGQAGAFARETPRNEAAYKKFFDESKRLVGVLDGRLADGRAYVAGDYSIADIANFTWFDGMRSYVPELLADAKHVGAWLARVGAREAVKKGMALEQ